MGSIDRTDAFAAELGGLLSDMSVKIVDRVRTEMASVTLSTMRPAGMARDTVTAVERLITERRARYRHFPGDLFHERAWDMLLELYVANRRNLESCVKDMVRASDGPPTTAVRWIDHLEKIGLVARSDDPMDRRRVLVTITPEGGRAMDGYLRDILSSSFPRP